MLAPEAFEGTRTGGYLDTATYGLPPRETVRALEQALAGWREWEDWQRWEADGEACRELFGRVAGVGADEVALLPAVSAAAGIVAASLTAGPGDNVVCYEREFQSALFPFLALERRGVEVRLLPLERLHEGVDARTQLVAVSVVQSADGRVADLDALRDTGASLFLDGTQSVGALPLDLEGVDFLAVGGYKWLLCPRGLAFFRARPERLEEIEPWLAGWKSVEDVYERYYGPPRTLATSARRLDTSLAWFLAAGARPSLELVLELGVDRIIAHDLALARRFCDGLGIPETGSAIVGVEVADAESTLARLAAAGIRAAGRDRGIRLAFHLYNTAEDVDRALAFLSTADIGPAAPGNDSL